MSLSTAQVYDDIRTGGVFEEGGLEPSHVFVTVHDAVLFATMNGSRTSRRPILEEVWMIHSAPTCIVILATPVLGCVCFIVTHSTSRPYELDWLEIWNGMQHPLFLLFITTTQQ